MHPHSFFFLSLFHTFPKMMLLKDCSLLLNILNNIFDCNRLGMKVDLLTQILPLLPFSTHKAEFNQQRTVGNQTTKISSALSHSPQPRVFHQWRKSRAIVKATLLTVSRWDDACQPCRCYQCFIFRFIIFFFTQTRAGSVSPPSGKTLHVREKLV